LEGDFSVICGMLITGGFIKKSRFSESQIVGILKESEGGILVADFLRTHWVGEETFYEWRSKYSGLEASELKCMKDLE
jgi:putative transposase